MPVATAADLGYAISEYLDVPDTMRRLKALTAQPVRGPTVIRLKSGLSARTH